MQLEQENKTAMSITWRRNQFIKWSGFGGVIGPILFVLLFTVAGFFVPAIQRSARPLVISVWDPWRG